jgi:hypothetical protein
MAFDAVESSTCDPRAQNADYLKGQLAELEKVCTDPASVSRGAKIRSTCLAAVEASLRSRKDARREIRAKYITEVSALLLDPDYPPAADRYREVRAKRGSKQEAEAAVAELAALARKHGINPAYGRELDLW